jgi:hypothetical protein
MPPKPSVSKTVKSNRASKTVKSNRASSKTRKTPRRSVKKSPSSSLKSRRSSLNMGPKVAVFQQSYSYSSNPMPGTPYGHLTRMMISNGKGKKMEANLNRHGVPINVKQSPVSIKRLNM